MSIFSENIRYLRAQKKLSQQELAKEIFLSRVRYSKYEDGRSEAPYEVLIRISKYFKVSIDLLLTVDIKKYPLEDVVNLPANKVLLPIVVDTEGNNFIEIVPQKASMGYLKGFSDPEYIESLQKIYFPFLKNGKYRGFLADGDSMPPFADQSILIGEYVEKLEDLKANKEYIFVTQEGITYKTFLKRTKKFITVLADNSFYEPYNIALDEIAQVWRYVRGILPQDYKPHTLPDKANLKNLMDEAKKSISKLENSLLKLSQE